MKQHPKCYSYFTDRIEKQRAELKRLEKIQNMYEILQATLDKYEDLELNLTDGYDNGTWISVMHETEDTAIVELDADHFKAEFYDHNSRKAKVIFKSEEPVEVARKIEQCFKVVQKNEM